MIERFPLLCYTELVKGGTRMMERGRMRRRAAVVFGSVIYALFASFGWQAQHLEKGRPALALLAAAALLNLFLGKRRA